MKAENMLVAHCGEFPFAFCHRERGAHAKANTAVDNLPKYFGY